LEAGLLTAKRVGAVPTRIGRTKPGIEAAEGVEGPRLIANFGNL